MPGRLPAQEQTRHATPPSGWRHAPKPVTESRRPRRRCARTGSANRSGPAPKGVLTDVAAPSRLLEPDRRGRLGRERAHDAFQLVRNGSARCFMRHDPGSPAASCPRAAGLHTCRPGWRGVTFCAARGASCRDGRARTWHRLTVAARRTGDSTQALPRTTAAPVCVQSPRCRAECPPWARSRRARRHAVASSSLRRATTPELCTSLRSPVAGRWARLAVPS